MGGSRRREGTPGPGNAESACPMGTDPRSEVSSGFPNLRCPEADIQVGSPLHI